MKHWKKNRDGYVPGQMSTLEMKHRNRPVLFVEYGWLGCGMFFVNGKDFTKERLFEAIDELKAWAEECELSITKYGTPPEDK
jgi:hypothetical protein